MSFFRCGSSPAAVFQEVNMKRGYIALLLAWLMLLASVPAAAEEAHTYNSNDLAALVDFLEQASAAEGKKNGEVLIAGYDPEAPSTFAEHEDYAESDCYSFIWEPDASGEYRLVSVEIRDKKLLAGGLDLSGCAALRSAALWNLPYLTAFCAVGCTALETLYCSKCGVERIEVSDCTSLACLTAEDDAALRFIDAEGSAAGFTSVRAEGEGSVGCRGAMLIAIEKDEAFLGWYREGLLVSTEVQLDCTALGGEFAARFGTPAIAGDIDCDGQISFNDVSLLYLALIGGEPAPAGNGDFNGDGETGFADITAMYLAMIG